MKTYISAFIISILSGIQFSMGHDISGSILIVAIILNCAYIDFITRLDNE
jgi:hypothetical protein